MVLATNRLHIFLIIIALILLGSAGTINNSYKFPKVDISKQDSAINFNDDLMTLFSLGQKRLLADVLWITTLLESDLEHYNKKDLNSWMYLRFKSIVKLDPKYLVAYRYGGKYLSIIKDDLLGAKEIFDKGLHYYPNDYNLLYDAAYLYAFELRDYSQGKLLYKKLSRFPEAPDFIHSLVNKLDYKIHNDINLTFQTVKKMWENTQENTFLKTRLGIDLYNIKSEIDLKCLNSKKIGCDTLDFEGQPYILKDGKYTSQKDTFKYEFHNQRPKS